MINKTFTQPALHFIFFILLTCNAFSQSNPLDDIDNTYKQKMDYVFGSIDEILQYHNIRFYFLKQTDLIFN